MRFFIMLLSMLVFSASAHEMVPTYPKLESSYMDGVLRAQLELFNKRKDVEYYDIGVFDETMKPVPFVSSYRMTRLNYLSHIKFEVFIRQADIQRATYVCSISKLRTDTETKTRVASRICSKFLHKK